MDIEKFQNTEQLTAEKAFEIIKMKYNPRLLSSIGDLFDVFFGIGKHSSNFLGGCGDKRRTLHETIFSMLYPKLKQQVVFGTGKGGLKKYLCRRFVADFYDEERKSVYEVDGKNHGKGTQKHSDKIKDCFFMLEHRIRVVRFTNKQVEEMLLNRLRELEAKGVLKDAVGYRQN